MTKKLKNIQHNSPNVYSIHYSCESLNDSNDNISPRVTSISLVHLESFTVHSFAIHLEAEIQRISIDSISQKYDDLEKRMLTKFFRFAEEKDSVIYLHWNMPSTVSKHLHTGLRC